MNFTQSYLYDQKGDDEHIIYHCDGDPVSYGQFKRLVKSYYKHLTDMEISSKTFVMIMAEDDVLPAALICALFAKGAKVYHTSQHFTLQGLQGLIDAGKFTHLYIDTKFMMKATKLKNINVHHLKDTYKSYDMDWFDMKFHNYKGSEIALFFHTTGSTGMPKLIPHTMKNIIEYGKAWVSALGIRKSDKDILFCGPKLSFNYGFGINVLGNIMMRTTAILLKSILTPKKIEYFFERYDPTYLFITPNIANLMCAKKLDISFKKIRKFISASDFLPTKVSDKIEKMYNKKLLNIMGQAEMCGFYTMTDDRTYRKGTVGKPWPGVKLKFDQGKLLVNTPTNAKEYYGESEKSAETFLPGNWVLTGDLGHMDEAGHLVFDGRFGNMFKINSNFIVPIEIENAIMMYEGIQNVVIRPCEEDNLPVLAADLVTSNDIDLLDLRKFLSSRLESYKIPKKFTIVKEIETLYNGKKIRPVIKQI
tara:strand:+ start:1401 stop:2828 length:1428 start_codon:yes stop_codon:yes gene_type:complete